LVTKKKITIHEFQDEQAALLDDLDIRAAWLDYLSHFPHQSTYFRTTPQYINQISVVNGKKAGTDINLYKLFLEQCFNLLRIGGRCGIILPGSVYNDLGAKQLRELLFSNTTFETIVGLSNERYIFEGVHHDQRFCLLALQKRGATTEFFARFRINVREAVSPEELGTFLDDVTDRVTMPVSLVRKLSPESLSIMDFRSSMDLRIADAITRFPHLGARIDDRWNVTLCNEFHMTGDSDLYVLSPGKGHPPLYDLTSRHQSLCTFDKPRYWVFEKAGRERLLAARLRAVRRYAKGEGASPPRESSLALDYESFRLAFRDVGPAMNERSMIATVLPPRVFCPHTMSFEPMTIWPILAGQVNPNSVSLSPQERLYLCAVMNSLIVDSWIKRVITKHLSFFYVLSLQSPD